MRTLRLKYVYEDVDRHGNVRVYYWRRPGRKVRLREPQGSPEFLTRYAELEAGVVSVSEIDEEDFLRPARAGTFRWAVEKYTTSAGYKRLEPNTQVVRRQILESCCLEPVRPGAVETYSAFPLSRLTPKAIEVLRDRKAEFPAASSNRLKALRQMLAWAVRAVPDQISRNVARDVEYLPQRKGGHHVWTPDEVAQFEARHPIGSKARLALALLLFTGVRRSDVVRLGRPHLRRGSDGRATLSLTAHKNRNRSPVTLALPVLPELQAVFEASPCGEMTFLATSFNRPFTAPGFGNWFRDRCNEAGLPHCSAHGLRKAGATIAADNGASAHTLMAIFGWLKIEQAEAYTREADRRRLARDGMGLLIDRRR